MTLELVLKNMLIHYRKRCLIGISIREHIYVVVIFGKLLLVLEKARRVSQEKTC